MTLENKLQQYSEMCGADVCLGIRIRESGEVFIFSADSSGIWSFLRTQLGSYYPTPVERSKKDLRGAKG
ncbi:hypothetical protein F1880_000447 [Penicillium rolfsii]|nr:hypothetical protein F1880_000447 [Penicillium rolfsii]